jgi:nitrite reductase/ring-hydroxylating ferredoxin subunit
LGQQSESIRRYVKLPNDLAAGTMRKVDIEGRPVCLARTSDNALFAIDDTCSHGEASLSQGYLDGHEIECPMHTGTFNLATGEAVAAPATVPLRVYEVELADEHLVLTERPLAE